MIMVQKHRLANADPHSLHAILKISKLEQYRPLMTKY